MIDTLLPHEYIIYLINIMWVYVSYLGENDCRFIESTTFVYL